MKSSFLTFPAKALRQRENVGGSKITEHMSENGHVTTNGQSEWKKKTSVNEIVARHSPKISPISKPGGCVQTLATFDSCCVQ